MRSWFAIAFAVLLPNPVAGVDTFPVLTYHDVTETPGRDPHAVTSAVFREQMAFLRAQGYQTLSLRQLADIEAGRAAVPARAVMLTFDDGLTSFVEQVLPVLEAQRLHAVLSVTTGWPDGRNLPPEYAGRIMTWAQLRRCARSPWVEILTHSDSLHQGVLANPQGDRGPAAITRRYDPVRGRYESEAAFRARIGADLQRSLGRLHAETGVRPAGITWPYGRYDAVGLEVARGLGLRWQLALGKGPAATAALPRISRQLVQGRGSLAAFEALLDPVPPDPPTRVAVIDLDAMPQEGRGAQERWLSALLDRMQLLRVDTVVVNPFTADGRQSHYDSRRMPVRADVLYRVLHQLRTRIHVERVMFSIAVQPPVRGVLDELARRHSVQALVLGAGWQAGTAGPALARFRRYQSDLACGVFGTEEQTGCADFRLVWVRPGEEVAGIAGRVGPVRYYYVVSLADDRDGATAVQTLRALRAAGARHVGVTDGAVLADPAGLQRVAVELGRHVIGEARNEP